MVRRWINLDRLWASDFNNGGGARASRWTANWQRGLFSIERGMWMGIGVHESLGEVG